MADIIKEVAKNLKIRETTLDNGLFKLFSVMSVTLCLAASLLTVANQYFGDPITCDFDSSVDQTLARQYCWIHGSFWVDEEYTKNLGCRHSQELFGSEEDAPTTFYYQWVVFVLLVQAGMFHLPSRLWKALEGGLIEGITSPESRSTFVLADQTIADGILRTMVNNFRVIHKHNNRYFITFVMCEALNLVSLLINFWGTDRFLSGQFKDYGFRVLWYHNDKTGSMPNPMCEAFPTVTNCILTIGGPGQRPVSKSGMCLLSQNIVNNKTFLVLYFWYIFVFAMSTLGAMFRLATLVMPRFRKSLLLYGIRGKPSHDAVNAILDNSRLGDWFVLKQISKNINPYLFRKFMDRLHEELEKSSGRAPHWQVDGFHEAIPLVDKAREDKQA